MAWNSEFQVMKFFMFRLIGYYLALILGNLLYRCTYEAYQEYKNITLNSTEMAGIIRLLLRPKFDNMWQNAYIVAVTVALLITPDMREAIFEQSDFFTVLIMTAIMLTVSSVTTHNQLKDSYKYFICNSGLDCGSFMAYSFYHGYIKYVVASNGDTASKGLVERISDYEAKHRVNFPIKKLLILQPQSMFIPPTLKTELLQDAHNLEEVIINRGGVINRSYQLSVYKVGGPNWYVNVQGASPLITYLEESKRSCLLDKYKTVVGQSFKKHLEKLISNDLRCRGLVDVIFYNDLDENGERIDVGVVLKDYIEKSLKKKALNDST